jgi:hypothetical protein
MNDRAYTLDQTDEEILASALSDEALEAAAGTDGGNLHIPFTTAPAGLTNCW